MWHTDGSKTKEVGPGVYGYGTRQKFSFNLRKYTAGFRAEMYAVENPDRDYKSRKNYILSDRM
jgi:hypothetical protein